MEINDFIFHKLEADCVVGSVIGDVDGNGGKEEDRNMSGRDLKTKGMSYKTKK